MNAVELTRRIVRIDTINPKSPERPCADLLGKLLGDAGYEVRLHEFAPGRASLVARGTAQELLENDEVRKAYFGEGAA